MLTSLESLNIPTITIVTPDGRRVTDCRPGHSISGLMHSYDPFIQRSFSLRAIARELKWADEYSGRVYG